MVPSAFLGSVIFKIVFTFVNVLVLFGEKNTNNQNL